MLVKPIVKLSLVAVPVLCVLASLGIEYRALRMAGSLDAALAVPASFFQALDAKLVVSSLKTSAGVVLLAFIPAAVAVLIGKLTRMAISAMITAAVVLWVAGVAGILGLLWYWTGTPALDRLPLS